MSKHDKDGLSQQARMVWLHIRDEGGWWSVAEIADAIGMGKGGLYHMLAALAERGHLVRRQATRCEMQAPGWAPSFGVTRACHPPTGYSLEPAA